jgi:hypothetical protein
MSILNFRREFLECIEKWNACHSGQTLLFIVAQISFQMFISTFLKRAFHGRILTGVVLVFQFFSLLYITCLH